ncbi:hypothetical protein NPIL_676681 [Nephila pilipes]|uniref:Uncharacterized protein n=1 Tax=Nephila pilipes TaxID=299642 RepID=A0A8X6MR45_NEPPI|nr:hypothetical protein NPIL_676681 [Nephila pilipes]
MFDFLLRIPHHSHFNYVTFVIAVKLYALSIFCILLNLLESCLSYRLLRMDDEESVHLLTGRKEEEDIDDDELLLHKESKSLVDNRSEVKIENVGTG